jgi:chemotaxis protein MotB
MENEHLEEDTVTEEKQPATSATVQSKPPAFAPTIQQQTTQPVFIVEDSFYRSRTPPRPVHWSIAWSDLMMTMFILFLVLFAHLRAHQEILAHGKPNKIADETIPVRSDETQPSLVFHPISQDISLKTGDKLEETALPEHEQPGADVLIRREALEMQPRVEPPTPIPELIKVQQDPAAPPPTAVSPPPPPLPAAIPQESGREEVISKIYDLSKLTLANEKMERFASVELVPDKTMRLILTGDLLFPSGQAELTADALSSLKKLSEIIKKRPT